MGRMQDGDEWTQAGIAGRERGAQAYRPLRAAQRARSFRTVPTSPTPLATTEWQPFHEPLRATLVRTIGIAILVGALFALRLGGLSRWPAASVVMLWPTLGGHALELWFLNWLRPRLPRDRGVQIAARVVLWFVGGMLFLVAMRLTAAALAGSRPVSRVAPWIGGLAFIGIELVVHLAARLRGRPSVYDGRG
jgi:uncharacterized membrane protein YgdD (TMEM256/DUF423 family)